jgi:hypothetical protein
MSLRCVGNQLLQTAPSLLLAGASKVSASLWVQVNPANNVAAANGVEIFGDAGGKFSATLSGTGTLQLQWSSNNGPSNGVSTCSLALTPGKSYHIASTWQANSQQYYLNGFQVGADIQGGTLGVLGDAASHAFRLGSDQAGVDVTLDQPTLWVGYALTAQDVTNLRNRSVQPGGVAPTSIALEWSLAGTAGASAKVGDAGLADASPNHLPLSSIVGAAPTYQAGDLTYVASSTIGPVVAAPSGKSIVLLAEDGTGVGSNIQTIASSSEIQSIKLVGQPAGSAFVLGFGGQTTAPIPTVAETPYAYMLWTIATVAGHGYTLAVTHAAWFASTLLYEVIQGGVTVATTQTNDAATGGFAEGTSPNGTIISWNYVDSGIVATGTTIQLRITASTDGTFQTAGLRVQDTTAGTVQHFAVNDPSFSAGQGTANIVSSNSYYGGVVAASWGPGGGLGPLIVASGGAAAVQSALGALPGVGPYGVAVTDLSGGKTSGNYQIVFGGILSNSPQPLITCPDPAVSISEVTRGGNMPTLSIGGGTPIPIPDWLWVTAGDSPYALGLLPQSTPVVQTCPVGQLPYAASGGYWNTREVAGSLSSTTIFGAGAGLTATYAFQVLPPGTYQIAITYQNAPFSVGSTNYTPSTATQFLIQDSAGNTLSTLSVNQSVAPADYVNGGRGWKVFGTFTTNLGQNGLTVVMNTVGLANSGNPTPVAVLDGVQLTRTSAAIPVIGPGQTATISIPAGWMTTSAGPLPATPGVTVSPPSPTSIVPAFVAGQKSMKVGYNVEPMGSYFNFSSHSNLINRAGPFGLARNSDGYPTKISKNPYAAQGLISVPVIYPAILAPYNDPEAGTYVVNSGYFTLEWDGSTTGVSLVPFAGTTITPLAGMSTITGTTGNRIIYNITSDPLVAASPLFNLDVVSTTVDPSDATGNTYLCNVTNIKIYPPDPSDPTGQTAWANPPKFHPWFVSKLQGAQCIRYLDPTNTNNNGIHTFGDYMPTTSITRGTSWGASSVPIISVGPPAPGLMTPGYTDLCVQVTTSAPHGLSGGRCVFTQGVGAINLVGGGTTNLDHDTTIPALCQVIDATNILIYIQTWQVMTMVGTVTPTGATLGSSYGSCWPLQDMVDLIVEVGCTDLWFNVSVGVDSSVGGCVDQAAAFLAANLPAGIKVHVEFGNECWNIGYPTNLWCAIQEGFVTGSYERYVYSTWYIQQSMAVHERFLAVFAAAGRPNDVACVYGGQGDLVGVAQNIAQGAQALGARMDEFCMGTYYNNQDALHGGESTQQASYDRMDSDQVVDFMEFNSVYGRQGVGYTAIPPILAANGYGSTKPTSYEGSPSVLVPGGLGRPNYGVRQNAVKRSPRMYGVVLQMAQVFQNAGITLLNYFNLGGQTGQDAWDAWESGNQQAGTGNPSLDVANATNPQAKNLVKSELGGAWSYWASLSKPTTIFTTKKPSRNGQVRATGLPRGVSRPTR